MSIEIVGSEVLPNLYIKNIQIGTSQIQITVAAFDYKDEDDKVTWMTTEFVRDPKIKMNLITTRNGSTLDGILNSTGGYNLYSLIQEIPVDEQLNTNSEDIQTKMLNTFDDIIRQKLVNSTPDSYIQINHTFSIAINKIERYTDIRCYCFFSYDFATSIQDMHYIDSDGQGRKLLTGPIFSEKIISNSSIAQKTNLFTYESLGYAGPVHFHDGRYMEGSFHGDEVHRFIERESVNNTKISVLNYEDGLSPKELQTTNVTSKFFGNPSIGVGNKKIYGFFRFKTEEFFKSKPLYNYFLNSFASLNIFKIRDNISMKIANKLEIKEIIMNSVESNDMWFYFEAPFQQHIETSINIEFIITNTNTIFRNSFVNIKQKANQSRSKILTLLAIADEEVIIESSQDILDYIVSYCTLKSMFYDVGDLAEFKKTMIYSLYKSRISKTTLQMYDNDFFSMIDSLSLIISDNDDSMANKYAEEQTHVIQLQNYKNCLTYLDNEIIVHPDTIADYLAQTNNKATESFGLFSNLEQVFLPRRVLKSNNTFNLINYGGIHLNNDYLRVLEPGELELVDSGFSVDFDSGPVEADPKEVDENSPGIQAQQYIE